MILKSSVKDLVQQFRCPPLLVTPHDYIVLFFEPLTVHLQIGNGRGFATPEGLRVRVPGGKGGGSYI